MNVIVSNKNQNLLNSLDVDVIKSINGTFSVDEIIATFSNFFFNRMFLDVTAIKDYSDITNIQKLSMGLEMDKVIFLLDNNLMSDKAYLSKLISMGIYNFANNKESLMYLYNHPNTYKDVANIHQIGNMEAENSSKANKKSGLFSHNANIPKEENNIIRTARVIGFKNATSGAGSTTLIYMLKKVLSQKDYVVALEVNKSDFGFFNEKDMYSVNQNNLAAAINRFGTATTILVDLNNAPDELCDDVIYLMEPSKIKLNKMVLVNKDIFSKLADKKIVLNKSLLGEKDINDFEFESSSKITFNIPPLSDRADNTDILTSFMKSID